MATQIFVILTRIVGEDFQFVYDIFSDGLKPPTSLALKHVENLFFEKCECLPFFGRVIDWWCNHVEPLVFAVEMIFMFFLSIIFSKNEKKRSIELIKAV